MALTTMKCPECGKVARTAKAVSPGTNVRCSGCKAVFPFRSSADDAFDGLSDFDENPAPLRERLGPVRSMSRDDASDKVVGRYGGTSNQALDPDRDITIDRMALKSERAKDRLRGGKPLRFEGSRKYIAAGVIVVVMGIGYIFFWLFYDFAKEAGNAQKLAQEAKSRKLQGEQKPEVKISDKSKEPLARELPTPKPAQPTVRATAPAPVRINDLVIGISAAKITRIAMSKGGNNNYYLTLSVQIDNRSGQPIAYKGWHYAQNLPILKDAKSKATYRCIKFMPIDLPRDCVSQATIQAGGSIVDLLVFEPPAFPYPSLELDLPSPIGYDTYKSYIPIELIQVVEDEPAQVADAAPQSATGTRPASKPEPTKRQLTRDEQIRAEYLEKWSEVVEIANDKPANRAGEYKRREKLRIQDELCKKYKVTKPDLKVILPQ
jgi:hypothetical protein